MTTAREALERLVQMWANADELRGRSPDGVMRRQPDWIDARIRLIRAALEETQEPAVTELKMCEAARLWLKPDQLYRFTVDPECGTCQADARMALGIVPQHTEGDEDDE